MFSTQKLRLTSGFNPASLNPQHWLDASDSSLVLDAAGASPAAPDAVIGRWNSKAGSAATQSVGGRQPVRKVAIQNGLDVIRFTTDRFSQSTVNQSVNTIFIVAKRTGGAGNNVIYQASNSSSLVTTGIHSRGTSNDQWGIITAGGAYLSSTVDISTGFHLLQSQFDGTTFTLRTNGGTVISSVVAGYGGDANDRRQVGATGLAGGTENFQGDLCELIMFNSVLSDVDRVSVENYLRNKWAIY